MRLVGTNNFIRNMKLVIKASHTTNQIVTSTTMLLLIVIIKDRKYFSPISAKLWHRLNENVIWFTTNVKLLKDVEINSYYNQNNEKISCKRKFNNILCSNDHVHLIFHQDFT